MMPDVGPILILPFQRRGGDRDGKGVYLLHALSRNPLSPPPPRFGAIAPPLADPLLDS